MLDFFVYLNPCFKTEVIKITTKINSPLTPANAVGRRLCTDRVVSKEKFTPLVFDKEQKGDNNDNISLE